MQLFCLISLQSFVILAYLCQTNAYLGSQPSVPENNKNVLGEWQEMEKELKSMTSSRIKSMMTRVLESADHVNLTSQCRRDLFILVAGVKSLKKWAFQFVDSSAKMADGILSGTTSSLGLYQECVNTRVPHSEDHNKIQFRGQYCTAEIRPPLPHKRKAYRINGQLEELQNYTGSELFTFLTKKAHLFYFQPLKAGLCIPSGCKREDLSKILEIASKRVHLDVDVTHCEVKETKKLFKVHVFAIIVCCILGGTVLLGTCLDMYFNKQQTYSKQIGIKFLLCFSLINNFKRLISIHTSEDNANLKCFRGFRFLSMTWVVLTHSYFYPGLFPSSYKSLFEVEDIGTGFFVQMIFSGNEAVDAFFFMSGCLLCYLTIKHVKVNKKKFDLKTFIIHRFWRIIPNYYFIILFAMLTPLMGSGPLFHETMTQSVYPCYQYWWRNMLFINNFFHLSEHCIMHTWYVACDMQLYLASLLVILPLLKCEKLGLIINLAIIAISVIYSGVISALKNLPPSNFGLYMDPVDKNRLFIFTYANPLSRSGPYFIGMIVGYLLATRPSLKISRKFQVIGWCLAVMCSGFVVFATAFWHNVYRPSEQEWYAYAAFFKVCFTSGIGWMIFCCCTGYGGFINRFLSWKAWVPLSKLTFLIYLIQPILQNSYIANFFSTQEYTHFHFVMQFFGFLCISFLLAMICNLLIESPFIAMEKLMLPERREPKPVKEINGATNYALEDIEEETNGSIIDEKHRRSTNFGI